MRRIWWSACSACASTRVIDRRPTIEDVDIEGSLAEIVVAASRWITDTGEVLDIARYSRAAGARDHVLFDDPEAFAVWADSLPADTNLLS